MVDHACKRGEGVFRVLFFSVTPVGLPTSVSVVKKEVSYGLVEQGRWRGKQSKKVI